MHMNMRLTQAAMVAAIVAIVGVSLSDTVEAKSRSRSFSSSSSKRSSSSWGFSKPSSKTSSTYKYRSTTSKPSLKPVPSLSVQRAKAQQTIKSFKPTGQASTIPPIAPKGMTIPKPPASMKGMYYKPKFGYNSAPYMQKRSDGTFLKIMGGMALGAFAYSMLFDDSNTMNQFNNDDSSKIFCATQEGKDTKILALMNLDAAWGVFKNNNIPMNCYNIDGELMGAVR